MLFITLGPVRAWAIGCSGGALVWEGDVDTNWYGLSGNTNWQGDSEPNGTTEVCVGSAGFQPATVNLSSTIASLNVDVGAMVLIPDSVILTVSGEVRLDGQIELGADAELRVGTGSVVMSSTGVISGSGTVQVDGGLLDVNGGNIFFGPTVNVANGTLRFAPLAPAFGSINTNGAVSMEGDVPEGITLTLGANAELKGLGGFSNYGSIYLLEPGSLVTDDGAPETPDLLTNYGTIEVSGGSEGVRSLGTNLLNEGRLWIDYPGVNGANAFTNGPSGNLTVTPAGALTPALGENLSMVNSGIVRVAGQLVVEPDYVQTGGETELLYPDPEILVDGGTGSFDLQGGTLTGVGVVNARVQNSGGIVIPGSGVDILRIGGDYVQGTGGTLEIDIEGGGPGFGHDQLIVGGSVTVAGTLRVDTSGFIQVPGQRFPIIDAPEPPLAPTVTGAFDTVISPGVQYGVAYGPSDVTLTIESAAWQMNGPSRTSTASDGSQFAPEGSYDFNYACFCFHRPQTWTFSTTAQSSGTLNLDYLYSGFHAFFDVLVEVSLFVIHEDVETQTLLLTDRGPACCDPPSGGFSYDRSTGPFQVEAGDTYGFKLTGSNNDTNPHLNGTIVVKDRVSVRDATVNEGGRVRIPIVKTGRIPTEVTVTVTPESADSGDFDSGPSPVTLTFGAEESVKYLEIDTFVDMDDESDETFAVTLSDPVNANIVPDPLEAIPTLGGTVTIVNVDDEPPATTTTTLPPTTTTLAPTTTTLPPTTTTLPPTTTTTLPPTTTTLPPTTTTLPPTTTTLPPTTTTLPPTTTTLPPTTTTTQPPTTTTTRRRTTTSGPTTTQPPATTTEPSTSTSTQPPIATQAPTTTTRPPTTITTQPPTTTSTPPVAPTATTTRGSTAATSRPPAEPPIQVARAGPTTTTFPTATNGNAPAAPASEPGGAGTTTPPLNNPPGAPAVSDPAPSSLAQPAKDPAPTKAFAAAPARPDEDPQSAAQAALQLPSPEEIDLSPQAVAVAAVLSLAALLGIGFPAEIFNKTVRENYSQLRNILPWLKKEQADRRLSFQVMALVFSSIAAGLIGSFQKGRAGAGMEGLQVAASLAIAFLVTNAIYEVASRVATNRLGVPPRTFRAYPGSLPFVALFVGVSAVTGLHPAYVYGHIAGARFEEEGDISNRERAMQTAFASLVLLGFGLACWALGAGVTSPFAGLVLAALTIVSLNRLVFALMPLMFLDGLAPFKHSKLLWAAIYVPVVLSFLLIILIPATSRGEGSVEASLVLFALFAAISFGLWAYFKRPRGMTGS